MQSVSAKGFSLVELVATLAIIGILAAFAIPRLADPTGFESRGFFDQSLAAVRYAQKIAIAQRAGNGLQPLIYVVITANQVRVCYDAACASAVPGPGGEPLAVTAPAHGAVTLAPVTTFTYSGSGAPSLVAQLEVTVASSSAGDIIRKFYVEPITGYAH